MRLIRFRCQSSTKSIELAFCKVHKKQQKIKKKSRAQVLKCVAGGKQNGREVDPALSRAIISAFATLNDGLLIMADMTRPEAVLTQQSSIRLGSDEDKTRKRS